jgi:anti-sigma regulatory factor (Ser/Thr protein kinase)
MIQSTSWTHPASALTRAESPQSAGECTGASEATQQTASRRETASPTRACRRFPAHAGQIGEARRFLRSLLTDYRVADDAALCLSEVATNSVIHSRSREPGGQFTVRAELGRDGHVRIAVDDQGGPWVARAKADRQSKRGLLLVSLLAGDWGIEGDGCRARAVWFTMGPAPGSAACPVSGDPEVSGGGPAPPESA